MIIILDYYLSSLFNPLLILSIISLNKYQYKYIVLIGILYDLLYSDVYLLNVLIFTIISQLKINKSLLKVTISVLIYQTISYLSYIVFTNYYFNPLLLLSSVLIPLISNLILTIYHNYIVNKHIISR